MRLVRNFGWKTQLIVTDNTLSQSLFVMVVGEAVHTAYQYVNKPKKGNTV